MGTQACFADKVLQVRADGERKFDMVSEDHLLRHHQVRKQCCLGRTRLYELREQGLFPAPLAGFGNRLIWRSSDVQAWIAARSKVNAAV